MEHFILYGFNAENVPHYNCSASTSTSARMKSTFLGCLFIAYGLIVEIIYSLVMRVIYRLKSGNSCYNLMFYLGIYDMLAIAVNSILTGYFWIMGATYCTNPNLNYISGSLGLGLWTGACMFCLILVLNRLCDLYDTRFADIFFKGWKMNVWAMVAVIYSLYFIMFTPPLLFNSNMTAWFFSPFIRNTDTEVKMFYNLPHTANNLFVVIFTCWLYILLCVVLGKKFRGNSHTTLNRFQKSVMIQSVLICMANLIAALIYVYMQFFQTAKWLVIIGHICWQAGLPAFVYLLLNHTIQNDIAIMLKCIHCRSAVTTTISIPTIM